jgi:hypothetical protein
VLRTVWSVRVLEEHGPSYRLAFDEGGRALDAQERSVNELRSRAGVLLATAAITTSFFGSRVVGSGDVTVAGHRSASWVSNARFVDRLHLALRIGLVLVAVEVSAWIVALLGQG